jgi:hypothetical protein
MLQTDHMFLFLIICMIHLLFNASLMMPTQTKILVVARTSNNELARKCSIYPNFSKIFIPEQAPPMNTWLEGEVPWEFNRNRTDDGNVTKPIAPVPPIVPVIPHYRAIDVGLLFI